MKMCSNPTYTTYSVSAGRVTQRKEKATYQITAASERETYGLYTDNTTDCAGMSHETQIESEDVPMGRNDVERSEDELESEDENEEQETSAGMKGDQEGDARTEAETPEAGATSERTPEREGEKGELEERGEWPEWLKRAVEKLEGGERGIQMKGVLERFVTIERALGFKGEKTVSLNSRTKQRITYQRTDGRAGRSQR